MFLRGQNKPSVIKMGFLSSMILMRVNAPLSLLKLTLKQLPRGNKFQEINGNKNKEMIIVDDYGDL